MIGFCTSPALDERGVHLLAELMTADAFTAARTLLRTCTSTRDDGEPGGLDELGGDRSSKPVAALDRDVAH